MTEYFTNNSRPYAENFNDGILLSDAVDLTVKSSIPSMYSDESFNSNLNVERLAGVSVVTMVANTGVTVGSTSLSGTGSVTFRVYPNFSLFERWNRISWTGTGDVSCSLAKVSGESIGVTVENGSTLASHNELSKLQQVDVTFVLSGASVSDISFEFVASADTDLVVASISQSNVAGLESSLSNLDSALTTGLDGKVDKVTGKGLSSNDFTDEYASLLEGTVGDNYDLCVLSGTKWGEYKCVKVNGVTIISKLTLNSSTHNFGAGYLITVHDKEGNMVDMPLNLKDIVENHQEEIVFSSSTLSLEIDSNPNRLLWRNSGGVLSNATASYEVSDI